MKHNLFLIITFSFSFSYCFAQADTAVIRLNNYRDKLFQIVNKCSLQDEEITRAIKTKDVNKIEAGRTALLQCATERLTAVDTVESFDGDASLKFSARETLKFYERLAEYDLPQVTDFFIQEEKFHIAKKEFKNKPGKKISESEIYAYNNGVKKYNGAVTRYTQLNNFITANRKLILYNWNASLKIFTDSHRNYMLKIQRSGH